MDESIVRGLVMGATLGAVGLVATLIWKVVRSPSERARRMRIVLGIALLAGIVVVAANEPERHRPVYIAIALAVAAGIWVFKGTKK